MELPFAEEKLDATNCDREPIHIPGLVQPYGTLFALDTSLRIERVSENVGDSLGVAAGQALGQCFLDLLAPVGRDEAENVLGGVKEGKKVALNLPWRVGQVSLSAIAHRYAGVLIVEIENLRDPEPSFPYTSDAFQDATESLHQAKDLSDLQRLVAEQVQRLTGFDRVMVYKFDDEWNGQVVAESLSNSGVDSYAGLWFPASDIPKQARQIFYQNWLRMIPDSGYVPVRILSRHAEPLDLSLSELRSVSPIHVEYLKNMKVGASLTISLRREGKLWGIVACHHNSPRWIGYGRRVACEYIGRLTSSLISAKEVFEDYDYRIKLQSIHRTLVNYMAGEEDFVRGLVKNTPNLLDLTASSGAAAAVYFEGKWTLIGQVPKIHQINQLVNWLKTNQRDLSLFHTNSLPALWPEAHSFKDVAAGIIAISIPKSEDNFILWFRPEVIQTVDWAGNPEKSVVQRDGKVELHPRQSFEIWKKSVRNTSLPWRRAELEAALDLRRSIIEIDLERQFRRERLARAEADAERRRVQFLSEVSRILAGSLDYRTTLENVAQLAVGTFSDWCSICIADTQGLHRAVVAHAHPQGQEVANEMLQFPCPAPHGTSAAAEAFTTGAAILGARIDDEWLARYTANPDFQKFIRHRLGLRSYICTPLVSRDRRIGLIEFAISESRRYYNQEDLKFAEELARRATVAIVNAELYRETAMLYEKTERANRVKEEVLAVVSHDLKNPVRSVLFNISNLQRSLTRNGETVPPAIQAALTNIRFSMSHMKDLIGDLLDAAKLEAKASFSLELSTAAVDELLREVVEVQRPLAEEKEQQLRLECSAQGCEVECDPLRLRQAFSNLIGNAIKFTPKQGSIDVRLLECSERVEFEVSDSGPGIPTHQLPFIFQRYWQGRSQSQEGLGLGLSIAKGIVDAHQGKLEVRSEANGGATFRITLPKQISGSTDPKSPPESAPE